MVQRVRNYDPIIEAAAQEYGVDPDLIRGMIAQESSGRPTARSSAGAMGLMQLMPETAADLGVRDPQELLDPETNIRVGTQYIAGLIDRFDGDVESALRAYNWGPTAVRQHQAGVRDMPTEAAEYPTRVLEFRDQYAPSVEEKDYGTELHDITDDQAAQIEEALTAKELGPKAEARARALLARYAENLMESAAVDEFATRIDRAPVPGVEAAMASRSSFLPGGIPEGPILAPSNRQLLNQAAATGVDIHTGAPGTMRATAGLLGLEPEAEIAALEYLARKQLTDAGVSLPESVPALWAEDRTGKLAYFRPLPNGGVKPTLINGVGVDTGDFLTGLDAVGGGVVEGLAAVGAGAAGAFFGGPATTAVAGAAGAAAGNAAVNNARKYAAEYFGLPKEIVEQITSDKLLDEALASAGFELAIPAIMGTVRRARNLARPLANREDLDFLKQEFDKIGEASRRLHEETGIYIRPTLAEATGDPNLLVAQANSTRDAFGRKSAQLREAEVSNRLATGDAIKRIHSNEARLPTVGSAEAAQRAQKVLVKPRDVVAGRVESAQKGLQETLEGGYQPSNKRFAAIAEDLNAQADEMIKEERAAWNMFREAVGAPEGAPASVLLMNPQDSPINTVLSQLDDQSKRALSSSLRDAQGSLVSKLGWKGADPGEMLAGARLDPNQAHVLVSHLKEEIRKAESRLGGTEWRSQDLRKVIGAIEEQLGNGQYRFRNGREIGPERNALVGVTYKNAVDASVRYHDWFDTKAVREIMREGKSPGAIRMLMFRQNDAEPLSRVLEIVGNNPGKRAQIGDELLALYKQSVVRDGGKGMSRAAHNQFMSAYQDHMRLLFGEGTPGMVENVLDMEKTVARLKAKQVRVERGLSEAFGKRVAGDDVYAGNIVRDLLQGNASLDQIANVRKVLRRESPELWAEVQGAGGLWLQERMLRNSGNVANAENVRRILSEHKDRLSVLFSPKYVKNLEDAESIMSAMHRVGTARASRVLVNPPALQVMRSIFGPLSPIQRRITALTRFHKAGRDALMYQVLTNPDRLESFVKLAATKPGTIQFVQFATAAGIPIAELDPDSQRIAEQWRRMAEQR